MKSICENIKYPCPAMICPMFYKLINLNAIYLPRNNYIYKNTIPRYNNHYINLLQNTNSFYMSIKNVAIEEIKD
jgi:hypothetical protein